MRRRRRAFALSALLGLATVTGARGAERTRADDASCGGPCGEDGECALEVGTCLVDAGEFRPALDVLKPAAAGHPRDGRLARALALAYLGLGTTAWAQKRLLAQLEADPGDTETRSWIAWLLIQEGDLDRAGALVEAAPTAGGPAEIRISLLRATVADLNGDEEGAENALREGLRGRGEIYPEDRTLLTHLRLRIRGDQGQPLGIRIHASGGYTSNAVQSAPTDPGAGAEAATSPGSPLLSLDAVGRFEPWTSRWVRPLGEVRIRGLAPVAPDTRDYAYANLGGRAGLELGSAGPLLRAAYSVELMAIHGGDVHHSPGPRWFTEAHRAEIEFLPIPALQVFGGAGRRIYRELPRTRTELDGGVAGVLPLPRGWNLTGIATGRYQRARHEAFHDVGATGLIRLVAPLPRGAMIKLKAMVVWDRYPHSAEYYGAETPRSDLLGKVQIGPWFPPLSGLRLGLSYTFAGRHSTLERYAYADHRVLLELRFDAAGDPTAPRTAALPEDHLPLPYGLDDRRGSGLDRVQDLLRQEDSARRGSSCVD